MGSDRSLPRARLRAVAHKVVFSPEAEADLRSLYAFILEQAGEVTASRYLDRIEQLYRGFTDFPQRGTARDDLAIGLRIVGFGRRMTIAFHVDEQTITFDRILYGGRDLKRIFGVET